MIKERFKHLLYRYVLPYGGLFIVKLLSFTYRVRLMDQEKEKKLLDHKKLFIYASWHQRFFPGITFFCLRKPIAIIISKSLDGELIARVVSILGWYPVRGSSSRDGKQALQTIKNLVPAGYKIGHIVDGPRGPFGAVKPGMIRIAQVRNMPILPTITSAQNNWVFNSWDRFMIPKPFSRVIIRFGNAIHIPHKLDKDEFEAKRVIVQEQMKKLYEDTDKIWSSPERMTEIF
jgi:lysophospholipid acyltransferase (LPLAT)-like uncharacterized protein